MSIDTQNFKPLQVLTIKDISFITGLGERAAKYISKDVKEQFQIERITYTHLERYLKV